MADIRNWNGVLISFNDEIKLISWEAYQDDDDIKTIEFYCYECFEPLSLGDKKLKRTECIYNQVQWVNNGYALPLYTTYCNGCQNVLDIQTEYCCIDHQIKITPKTSLELLKIMIKQITEEKTLCPYIIFQAHMYSNIQLNYIEKLIKVGKEYISLFDLTPAGLMLESLMVSGVLSL